MSQKINSEFSALLPEIIRDSLVKSGVTQELSSIAANDAALRIKKSFGGVCLYIPRVEKDLRNAKIKKEFNGQNYDELAIKYGLSHVRIRDIIKKR